MKEKVIKVLLVEPGKKPRAIEIENTLEAKQQVVGGAIEQLLPWRDEVALICNEEGKGQGLPLNRAIFTEPDQIEMTWPELRQKFEDAEKSGEHITGYIVFAQESFGKPYSEESRTYAVSSNNKAFQSGMGGYSIFGSCLDGTDPYLRLDLYMRDKDHPWKVEKCYIEKGGGDLLDIIEGTFFVVGALIDAEDYSSLSDSQIRKYSRVFQTPEAFILSKGGVGVIPYIEEEMKEEDR